MNNCLFKNKKHLFSLPENKIYLCGHSLGPMPKAAKQFVEHGLKEWEMNRVNGWIDSEWIHLPQKLGKKIAPLIGALPDEVIVTDSTSINLFKLLLSALDLNPQRNVILTESSNFPADLYIVQSVAKLRNTVIVNTVSTDQILAALNKNVAVLMLTQVNYRTGYMHDMEKISKEAHKLGVLVLWDLSHSIGAIPLSCSELKIDFAVGCTYKYVNGGPGSPGFLYINKKHHSDFKPAILGWMGHKEPFAFSPVHEPADGVTACLTGTPFILSMKALEGALEIFDGVNFESLRAKSIALSDYLIRQIQNKVPLIRCESPIDSSARGSHVAFSHPHAYPISRAMIANGVTIDYREPNILRFGISPLYLDFEDIERAVDYLANIMNSKFYEDNQFQKRLKVT